MVTSFLKSMIWVILLLVAAGLLFHLLVSYGVFPGVLSWVANKTNLSAQAGG